MSGRICYSYSSTGSCARPSCKFEHVGPGQGPSQGSSHGRKNSNNNRNNSGGTFTGAAGETFGWFDEPSSGQNNGGYSRQQPRSQQQQPRFQQQQHRAPQQYQRDQGAKRGQNKQSVNPGQRKGSAKQDNRPNPVNDLFHGLKRPNPLVDDSWKEDLPRDNFRFQSIAPSSIDIEQEQYPDPPENITHKAYDSTEQYLETHFKLLRADCIIPVRSAIRAYRLGAVDDNELIIYVNVNMIEQAFIIVRPTELLFATFGIVHRMSFIVDGRRVNWRQSKRLIPGTIVCLSANDFEHYRFATVIERDLEFLQNPRDLRIGLKFLDPDPRYDFNPDIRYTMIEAMQGYFEAYQHVLKCLQDIDPLSLPFQPQLVGLEPLLEQPKYSQSIDQLQDEGYIENSVLDFPDILKGDDIAPPARRAEPSESDTGFKDRRVQPNVLEAMDRMLNKDFAIVQGPPGTGKTFLGLLATNLLLENCRTKATGPIIVVCQTNHALDQFLEGVMKFEDRVIRLGSRSKSQVVAEKTLYNIKQKYKNSPDDAYNDRVSSAPPRRFFKMKDKLESDMLALLEELAIEYVPLSRLLDLNIITQEQFDSFAHDGWVTRFNQEEDPTAEPWLQSAQQFQDPGDISVFEDSLLKDDIVPEIDEEELQERVEDFMIGSIEESKISGNSVNFKQSIVCHVDDLVIGDVGPFMTLPNVYDIPINKRLGVYKRWLQKYQEHLIGKLGGHHTTYNLVCENIRSEFRRADKGYLSTARIIGMTTTAASKYHDLLSMLKPKIMICEEASETMEAHLICALTPSIEHFILIGDHEQLRPSMSVDEMKYKQLDVSMFERLVKNNFPYSALNCQRRMRPEIRSLIKPIYGNLIDHESVRRYGDVKGMVDNLWFWTHSESDRLGTNNSHYNPHEVGIATRLAIYLLQQGYEPSKITILAMYSGQRNKIQEKLRQMSVLESERIRVSTVDGFQGEENEIIILSLVRSNDNNSIGFLKTSNRVCVALSRAKKKSMLRQCKTAYGEIQSVEDYYK
ncbi:NFX1-type zinc finger-containing protein 1 [Entomortierella beljakovae]|nr:NFX1-type zinc finger-containing protein 1 [Entomortierella beljakovae]